MNSSILAFDLSYEPVLQYHIPRGLIVEQNNSRLGYFVKYANPETLQSHGVALDEHARELLLLCDKLHPNDLSKKYNAKNKTPKPLKVLLEDPQTKGV